MMCGITGTPGTGKSVIADELSRRGHTVVHITDIIQPYVIGDDKKRDTQVIDVDRLAAEFKPVDGFVEGHFAHLLPCDRIVVLRCRPDELASRLKSRAYSAKKIQENTDAEALDVCLIETVEQYDPAHILELDSTGRDLVWCADRIEGFVRGEIPASFGTLDWSSFVKV
ncbi:MAG: adenylate kinase family protein [Methanoregula sp.]|nr:adenylate kinase family protein [Methanoregula sp.]